MRHQKRPPIVGGGPKISRDRAKILRELGYDHPEEEAEKVEPVDKVEEKAPRFGDDPQALSRDFRATIVQQMARIVEWAARHHVPVLESIDWLCAVRQEVLLMDKIQYETNLLADVIKVKNRPSIGMLGPDMSYDCLRNHLAIIVAKELESCYAGLSDARQKLNSFQLRYPGANVHELLNMAELRPAPRWPEDRP